MRLTNILFGKKVGEFSKKYANLPDRYVERKMRQIYWSTPRGKPQYQPRTMERERFWFGLQRPWTNAFQMENMPKKKINYVHVEPIKNWSFFRGDRVELLCGPDKGRQGIVKQIIQERNWVIVEGLNVKLKRVAKSRNFPGTFIQEEQPLLVTTQIRLVDPHDLKPTTIEWRYTEDGSHVRVSTRTGRIIPVPVTNEETYDYRLPALYHEQAKDTAKDDVEEVTFEPKLKTFEMDIMDSMGIKDDRVPKKYYWY